MQWALLEMLLSLLLQWWMNRKKSGQPLTGAEARRQNGINFKMARIRELSCSMGCLPEGEEDPAQTEPAHLMGASPELEWRPGDVITDRLYQFVVSNYIVPGLKKKLPPELQGAISDYEAQWGNFLVQQIKDSQT